MDDHHIRRVLVLFPRRAVQMLYDKYYHSLIEVSLRLTEDLAASKDIVQEAFVLLWEQRHELSAPHAVPIQAYLIQVVKYKSIDYYRRGETAQRIFNDLQQQSKNDVDPPVEKNYISDDGKAALWKLIQTFPRRERECLELRYRENLSIDEIALRLKISRKGAERALTNAKKRLQQIGKDRTGYYIFLM